MTNLYDNLCDILNDFYEDIRPDLFEMIFSAIKAAQNTNELNNQEIFRALHLLIITISNPNENEYAVINTYLSNPHTQGSVTLPFFYNNGYIIPEELTEEEMSQRAQLFLSQPLPPIE